MTVAALVPLAIAAVAEVATGVALLASPWIVVDALLDAQLSDAGVVVARIAGIALVGLGIACWPGGPARGLLGMTVYSASALVYMTYVGVSGAHTGALWWPAVGAHAVLTVLLARSLVGKAAAAPTGE